jgi:hypothetical protein
MAVETEVTAEGNSTKDKMTTLLIVVPLVAAQGAWVGFLIWIFIVIV